MLHWDGSSWHREAIETPPSATEFEVLAIGASSPQNAWLLARYRRRTAGRSRCSTGARQAAAPRCGRRSRPAPAANPGPPIEIAGETLDEPGRDQAQLLTVTLDGGVARRAAARRARARDPLLHPRRRNARQLRRAVVPDSRQLSGRHRTGRKRMRTAPPSRTARRDYSLSFAWPGAGYGERIVTGGFDGRLLRLSGVRMEAVNSLGSQLTSDPGATFGAAFSELLRRLARQHADPGAHHDARQAAAPSKLSPWPVPFRFASDRARAEARS